MMRSLLLALTLLGSANAGPVTWYLHGLHYSENQQTSQGVPGYSIGQFTYDADLNLLSTWSITDLGDFAPWFPATYSSPEVPGCCVQSPTAITMSGLDSREHGSIDTLFLRLAQPLTDAGGSVQLIPALFPDLGLTVGTFESIKRGGEGQEWRYLDAGAYVSTDGPTTTPEPTTFSAMGLALMIAGMWRGMTYLRHGTERRA